MKDKKGFSGLDELGSEIDDILKVKSTKNSSTKNDFSKPSSSDVENSSKQSEITQNNDTESSNTDLNTNNNNSSSSAWLWFIGFIIVAVIIGKINSNSSSSSSSSSHKNNNISGENKNYKTVKRSSDYYESKPEVYTSVLSKNELLYCEAEKIRLDVVQHKIDKYSSYEIDKYNSLSSDYNNRCANKQYYKSSMNYVNRQIKDKKYRIQQEGLERFGRTGNSYNSIYSLTVNTYPFNARVRIMNIKPKYYDGIRLKKGKYHIVVSQDGYYPVDEWMTLNRDTTYTVTLNQKW